MKTNIQWFLYKERLKGLGLFRFETRHLGGDVRTMSAKKREAKE